MEIRTDVSKAKSSSTTKPHRLLCLQNSSIFESFGGIEFYQDDLLALASDLYPGAVCAVLPQKTPTTHFGGRPYTVASVPFGRNPLTKRIENRLSLPLFRKAVQTAAQLSPTLIIAGHISLAPLAYALSRWIRIPYVVIAYGIECWGTGMPQDELAFRRAAGILSISQWTKKILVERGISEAKIKVIHPQLPTEFERIPYSARPAHSPFTLLTVSRLDAGEQYKGHDHVMQALSRLAQSNPERRFRYIIQGDGSDRPRLEALSNEFGLAHTVEFRSKVKERSSLADLYHQADVFIMPSSFENRNGRWRGEGFGIVYLEAAAFSVPSIAYDCGGATDIIRNDDNGLLIPLGNTETLAQSILELAQDETKRLRLGKSAHSSCMTHFTRPAIRRAIAEALNGF